jgi:prephenate dehydratase
MVHQSNIRAAFQGERGAYSETAVRTFFSDPQPVPCRHFADVFHLVQNKSVDCGVLPFENALTGSIHENFDLLLQFPEITILGEIKIRIEHSLIGLADAQLSDIRQVLSHPQGLLQCEAFLDSYRDWERIPHYDTAGSVADIVKSKDVTQGAIANSLAAEIYGARVLVEGIETNRENYTRFFVIGRSEEPMPEWTKPLRTAADKGSIVFSTRDKPGALLEAMQVLAARQLNLQKIESRPIHGKPWTYMFYLDFDLPADRELLPEALEELALHSENVRVLGVYRRG